MRFVVGFGRFWYDFIVGDDWRIAAGVVGVLARRGPARDRAAGAWLPPVITAGLVAVFAVPLLRAR